MNRILLILTIFSFGYVFNDILEEYNLNVIGHAQAEVDGMSWRALKRDRDLALKAVLQYKFQRDAAIDEKSKAIKQLKQYEDKNFN